MNNLWLVIIDNDDFILRPYSDRYRIYSDRETMLKWAKENGFQDPLGMGISTKVGQKTMYRCGKIDIAIIPLTVQESNEFSTAAS